MATPTIYIVSGFMRSCTSAMMRCLEAGGMITVHDNEKKRKQLARRSDEFYEMNPDFYELMPNKFDSMDFLKECQGKVVKILAPGLHRLPTGLIYRIIFMLRHPIEIHASYIAAFEQTVNEAIACGAPLKEYPPSPAMYYFTASRVIKEQRAAGHFVSTVGARSMIKRPRRTFEMLANRYGWPIDPIAAAAKVEPERYRFKLEDLKVRDYEWERRRDQSPYEDFGGTWPKMPIPRQRLIYGG